MAIYGSLGEINVGALNATISDTAVDVFVYDTRKDSDGGQWRKRTQHTSWYNETLNTATRGSRRDFPAVAIIVSELEKVTIYDGDDPDMPMWMVFQGVTSGWKFVQYGDDSGAVSIHALNGILCVGNTGTSYGSLHVLNFIKEKAYMYVPALFEFNANFVDRNVLGPPISQILPASSIVSNKVNDVAMTVLPNAPIDSATGLPVPTIAVATQQGISIITDSGTIYNLTPESDPSYASIKNFYSVGFDSTNKIFFTDSQTTSGYSALIYLPSYNYNQSLTDYYSSLTGSYNYVWGGDIRSTSTPVGTWNVSSTTRLITESVGTKDSIVMGYSGSGAGDGGLSLIGQQNNYLMNCKITTSYNTGWMHGDIKGAWLSDTSTASVTGTELVTNGDGTTTTGWTAGGGNTLIVTDGNFKCTTNIGDGAYFGQGISVVSGRSYVFQATAVNDGTSNGVRMILGGSVGGSGYADTIGYSFGTITLNWTATTTGTVYLWFYGSVGTAGSYILVDNISARLAELDRSVNNKGLAVFGTITKTPVATGSNLVAYGGFSASNYLLQPYNSSLDFGTGDFSVMCWAYRTVNATRIILDKSLQNSTQTNRFVLYFDNSAGYVVAYDGASAVACTSNTVLPLNVWTHIVFVRRSSVGYLYMNGNLVATQTGFSGNFSNSSHQLVIGNGFNFTTYPWGGSLSLARISTSTPSSTQIAKIYEDEKALFQPNSQCTLYGSSDAVTALAYDDTTRLLSVGTSSGRSDFQGLERINNTTTAVTTAISASNGLIAEQ